MRWRSISRSAFAASSLSGSSASTRSIACVARSVSPLFSAAVADCSCSRTPWRIARVDRVLLRARYFGSSGASSTTICHCCGRGREVARVAWPAARAAVLGDRAARARRPRSSRAARPAAASVATGACAHAASSASHDKRHRVAQPHGPRSTRRRLRERRELRLERVEVVVAEDHAPPQHERIGEEARCRRASPSRPARTPWRFEQVDDRFVDVAVRIRVGRSWPPRAAPGSGGPARRPRAACRSRYLRVASRRQAQRQVGVRLRVRLDVDQSRRVHLLHLRPGQRVAARRRNRCRGTPSRESRTCCRIGNAIS